ncbi:hypothetical protein [Undibacterium squillarum]|uniref:hypothetical protein n=1 Tax=Undibacterium squillarum TaxID=1131567 RepID=UPI0035B3DE22
MISVRFRAHHDAAIRMGAFRKSGVFADDKPVAVQNTAFELVFGVSGRLKHPMIFHRRTSFWFDDFKSWINQPEKLVPSGA